MDGCPLLKPKAAVLTTILPDHLDRYNSMEEYVSDKRVIYQGQDINDLTVAADDDWGRSFLAESKARPIVFSGKPLPEGVCGGWIDHEGPGYARIFANGDLVGDTVGEVTEIVPPAPLVPGYHQKQNLLAAGLTLLALGFDPETIRKGLGSFPGVEHRLELFHRAGGVAFYNDSAATIPEAAVAALEALGAKGPLVLVTGGTDKNLDFLPLAKAVRKAAAAGKAKAIILLAGSGSDKLRALLDKEGTAYLGPFDLLEKAVSAAIKAAAPTDRVVLSPGCASFGMFLNEFDRGNKWKETVKRQLEIY
jgi:UDP-N-acetylmuramoylalanine--D-glutamate ligase